MMNADELRDRLDEVYIADILQARRMSMEEKLLAGPRLFEYECQIAREAIRQAYPNAGANEVERLLRDAIERQRTLENAEAYIPIEV